MEENIVFMPATKIPKGGIAPRVIVCGDPFRAVAIADKLEGVKEVAHAREYRTFNGNYKGEAVTVVSHGVGSPGAAVCFEELIQAGAEVLIRVGTAGTYTEKLPPGSLIIADSAVREEGLTKQLVPATVPAVASFQVTQHLNEAAQAQDVTFGTGTIVTLDVFYPGAIAFPHKLYKDAGALGAEMEMSALFTIAKLRGVRAGGILAIDGYAYAVDLDSYNPDQDHVNQAVEDEIQIALNAIVEVSL